jgi:restriction system protein
MRPLLEHLADGEIKTNRETMKTLGEHFDLTSEELVELLPSGQQPVFINRVAWAKAHLKGAGLIESPARGQYRIAQRGLAALKQKDRQINLAYLKQFKEYRSFREPNKSSENKPQSESNTSDTLTPSEYIEHGYQKVREELESELLAKIMQASPAFFERLVVELLVAMGYGGSRKSAGEILGKSGDEGIDGVIKEDRLGLDAVYIQAKRWEGAVGRPEVQKFAGALQGRRAKKGVFLTTSSFSKEAHEYASQIDSRVILIGGIELASLMVDSGVGVSKIATYEINRLDSDYFEE